MYTKDNLIIMQRIEYLKSQNIKFSIINEEQALQIMCLEFPLSKIEDMSSLFEKYRTAEKKNTFVNLDFAHLYYLALIDEELSDILMRICLDLEAKLKTILINDVYKLKVADKFLNEYISSDYAFLSRDYSEEINDFIKFHEDYSDLYTFDRFLNMLPLGAIERIIHSFYDKYCEDLQEKSLLHYEKTLNSIRHIRNCVAHNGAIISKANIIRGEQNSKVSAYLKHSGVGERTLSTNLSKTVIFDIANILHLYCVIQPNDKIKKNNEKLSTFIKDIRKRYRKYFIDNEPLVSIYRFLRDIIEIYSKKIDA